MSELLVALAAGVLIALSLAGAAFCTRLRVRTVGVRLRIDPPITRSFAAVNSRISKAHRR